MKNCDLNNNGRCRKMDARYRCYESNYDWFHDNLKECDVDEVCRKSSIFGNRYYKITDEQLDALKQGNVLYDVDEYGTFIILEKEEQNESNA